MNARELEYKNIKIENLDILHTCDTANSILTTLSFLKRLINKEKNSKWENILENIILKCLRQQNIGVKNTKFGACKK